MYDKLFEGFTIRQLRKSIKYNSVNDKEKREIEKLFRLRIGFFATMLFLHDRVHHLEKDFDEELNAMGLSSDKIKAKNILDGFFFIHKDKSTDGHEIENLSFEFLHKTFGEFLAADFMLRIAKLRAEDDEDISHLYEEKYFRQIFSFQWIYKQPKILEFLLEHATTIIGDSSQALIKQIKKELKNLLDENTSNTLPAALHQLKTFEKLKHSAIYSENLLLLWIALEKDGFEFNLSRNTNSVEGWKVFVDLWKNYGGYEYVSHLSQYIRVNIEDAQVLLTKVQTNTARFTEYSNYTQIADNAYESILSFYDVESITLDDILKINYSKDRYYEPEISNLIIERIEVLYKDNQDFFDDRTFWNLWKHCSFHNKIRLSNFYQDNHIDYMQINVAKYLYNSITDKDIEFTGFTQNEYFPVHEKLSSSQAVYALEHFLKLEESKEPAERMLRELIGYSNLERGLSSSQLIKLLELSLVIDDSNGSHAEIIFKELIGHSEKGRNLSINYQLKLLELSLVIDDDRGGYAKRISKDIIIYLVGHIKEMAIESDRDFTNNEEWLVNQLLKLLKISLEVYGGKNEHTKEIYKEFLKNSKRGRRLSPSDQLRFLELSLEFDGGRNEYVEGIHRELLEHSMRGRRLSLSDQLRFLELSLEFDGGRNEHTEGIYRELLKHSMSGNRRLSPSDQLRFLELSLEFDGGRNEYTQEIIRRLKNKHRRDLTKMQINYISFIENRIRQL